MPARRTNPNITLQAPNTGRTLAEDWKLEAACAEWTGSLMDIPTSLCAVCPVQEQCGALYEQIQTELTEGEAAHSTKLYIGGVWRGILREEPREAVRYGSMPIEPCGDECDSPRWAKGACRNHYNQQWGRLKGKIKLAPPRLCSEERCDEKHEARGYCAHHYHKWRVMQADLGIEIVKPPPTRSSKPIDEPTYAGYRRAQRAGVRPTPAQAAANAAYTKERWLEKRVRVA